MIKPVLVTAPDAQDPVVTVAEAKTHLRIPASETGDDTYVASLVSAAVFVIEAELNRKLCTQTWDIFLDCFPDENYIEFPFHRAQSIGAITYEDANSATQTLSSSKYSLDNRGPASRVVLEPGEVWPDTEAERANAVSVRFNVGYGVASAVPEPIKQAIKIQVGDWYEHRQQMVVGTIVGNLPKLVSLLLADYRVYTFA